MEAEESRPDLVGRVVGLWRYPVKSMAEESLGEASVGWHGVAGDRRWAFVRPDRAGSGFPWLTIREHPEMNRYQPSLRQPDRADGSPVVVRTPSGEELSVVDPALAARLGDGVRVMKQNRGVFDTMPVSLISRQSLAALQELVDLDVDVRRFRPNVLVDAADGGPFPEDAWVGRTLTIGGVRVRVDQRDQRCVLIDVDPVSSRRDPQVLRALARERQGWLGVYGSTVSPGRVAVGDPVLLEPL